MIQFLQISTACVVLSQEVEECGVSEALQHPAWSTHLTSNQDLTGGSHCVCRCHASSGTSGKPCMCGWRALDWIWYIRALACSHQHSERLLVPSSQQNPMDAGAHDGHDNTAEGCKQSTLLDQRNFNSPRHIPKKGMEQHCSHHHWYNHLVRKERGKLAIGAPLGSQFVNGFGILNRTSLHLRQAISMSLQLTSVDPTLPTTTPACADQPRKVSVGKANRLGTK